MDKLIRFFKEEDGVTAIEYALIASVVALGILVALLFLRNSLNNKYNTIANTVNTNYAS
jgi:pilus assembly protein Flp/PilA